MSLLLLVLLISGLIACAPNNSGSLTTNTGNKNWYYPTPVRQPGVASTSTQRLATVSTPETSGDLWDLIRSGFQIPSYNEKAVVQAQIRWFINRPRYLHRTINRAAPYLYYIYEQVRQRHLPTELVLLPIIESAYNPLAKSPASATGLWQLMAGTARGFGVRQDWLFDGRRDIHTSTKAALDYLTYLHAYFSGDWLLTLGAYNTGEGTIQNAIRYNASRGRGTRFWDLPLSAEARSYTPRLLAIASIIKHPSLYGISLPTISSKPYLTRIDIDRPISLRQASYLTGIRLTELQRLNPGFKSSVRLLYKPHKLMLPLHHVAHFRQQLSQSAARPPTIHAVDIGLRHINKQRPRYQYLPQSSLNAYSKKPLQRDPSYARMLASPARHNKSGSLTAPFAKTSIHYHTIKPGDTLTSVAKHYQVTIAELRRWNQLEAIDRLHPGKNLVLLRKQTPTKGLSNMGYYVVQSRDNLTSIAKRLGIEIIELKRWNQLKHDILHPGQYLKINKPFV